MAPRTRKPRLVYHTATGGTIGSGKTEQGARDVDPTAQEGTFRLLNRIPFAQYKHFDVVMRDDSSAHPREHLIDLGKTCLTYANEGHGMVIEFGTDTMNLTAATLALMGNELWKYPVVLLGSMRGTDCPNSDAPINTITAGFFAAYADASGVFAVRPNGVIITSRHDTPGGSIDWHGRKIPQAETAYFARIKLDRLINTSLDIIFDIKHKKNRNVRGELEQLIEYQRDFRDGTLDSADQIVVGGRARIPNPNIIGYGRDHIVAWKKRPVDDTPEKVRRDMLELIRNRKKVKGYCVGEVIPAIALIEHIKRHRAPQEYHSDKHSLHEKWDQVFRDYLEFDLKLDWNTRSSILSFWKKYSDIGNTEIDFKGLVYANVASDPEILYRAFQTVSPRGIVLQATGGSGVRLKPEFEDNYLKLLTFFRDSSIPVVLTASSRGEVTSFEYTPGLYLLENDLAFFAGTMDDDLVQPRMALLNSSKNRGFITQLVNALNVSSAERAVIERNMYRQLLSGSHYRKSEEGEIPDRQRVETLYGIETRVDLLSGMHAKKAILASYLNEVVRRDLKMPETLPTILETN